jgi:UDP-GlcNAc:undecaprenyl-phosphate/decaprenyl-phosphate GlcNAc-1-phosphate transferase
MASRAAMRPFLVGLVAALVLTPCVVWLAHHWQLIDVPNDRSSHVAPTPRGGGIAVAIATVAGVVAGDRWSGAVGALVVGALVLAATGLLDDRFGLPALPRLAIQLLTPAVVALVVIERSTTGIVLGATVAALIAAGYINAFNFMDGINGISGTQAAVAAAFLAAVARHTGAPHLTWAALAAAGAALGFLPFNALRPLIFLGDVGSYFLGCWLAGVALLLVDAGASALVVLGPFLLYLFDTSSVLVRRALRGDPIMQAHREHAYQRLVQRGWSHPMVAVLCAAIAGASALLMYSTIDGRAAVQIAALGICGVLAVVYLALPSVLTSVHRPRTVA